MTLKTNKFFYLFLAAFLALFSTACEPAPSMMNKPTPTPAPVENAPKVGNVEREINDMKDAGFKIIYVFKRKDGGVFDREDKQFIKANTPDINRRVVSDDEKAFIAGSNYQILPENLEALQKRFNFENYSEPGAEQPPATNTNQAPKNESNQKNANGKIPVKL